MRGSENIKKPGILKRLSRKIYLYLFLLVLFFLSLSFIRTISNIKRVEQKIADKEQEVQKKKEAESELQKKLEFAKSSEFMEKQLRDKLGLVKEGEIVVVLPPPEVLRQFAPKYEDEKEIPPEPNWRKWLKLFL